jgi:hypothetical protein
MATMVTMAERPLTRRSRQCREHDVLVLAGPKTMDIAGLR